MKKEKRFEKVVESDIPELISGIVGLLISLGFILLVYNSDSSRLEYSLILVMMIIPITVSIRAVYRYFADREVYWREIK